MGREGGMGVRLPSLSYSRRGRGQLAGKDGGVSLVATKEAKRGHLCKIEERKCSLEKLAPVEGVGAWWHLRRMHIVRCAG